MKAEPELQIKSPLIHPEERSLWCKTRSWNPFPSKTSGWTAELGEVMRVRNSARAHSYCGARDGRKTDSRMMPFMEIVFCGLATWIFPFSWYWEGWTRPALVGLSGTRGHHGRSPAPQGHALPPQDFLGTPRKQLLPCPPWGSQGPSVSSSEPWVSLGAILHYQTSLALSIGNFYNSLLGWKRWLQQTQIRNKLYNNFTFFLQRKTVWQELWKHLLPMSSQQGSEWKATDFTDLLL